MKMIVGNTDNSLVIEIMFYWDDIFFPAVKASYKYEMEFYL